MKMVEPIITVFPRAETYAKNSKSEIKSIRRHWRIFVPLLRETPPRGRAMNRKGAQLSEARSRGVRRLGGVHRRSRCPLRPLNLRHQTGPKMLSKANWP